MGGVTQAYRGDSENKAGITGGAKQACRGATLACRGDKSGEGEG